MPCAIIENINTSMSLVSDFNFNLVGYYYFWSIILWCILSTCIIIPFINDKVEIILYSYYTFEKAIEKFIFKAYDFQKKKRELVLPWLTNSWINNNNDYHKNNKKWVKKYVWSHAAILLSVWITVKYFQNPSAEN